MKSSERLHPLIESALKERMPQLEVERLEICEDVDFDEAQILRVAVIYRPGQKPVDSRAVAGLIRILRPKLLDVGEERFPLVSFVSNQELEGTSPEAA